MKWWKTIWIFIHFEQRRKKFPRSQCVCQYLWILKWSQNKWKMHIVGMLYNVTKYQTFLHMQKPYLFPSAPEVLIRTFWASFVHCLICIKISDLICTKNWWLIENVSIVIASRHIHSFGYETSLVLNSDLFSFLHEFSAFLRNAFLPLVEIQLSWKKSSRGSYGSTITIRKSCQHLHLLWTFSLVRRTFLEMVRLTRLALLWVNLCQQERRVSEETEM